MSGALRYRGPLNGTPLRPDAAHRLERPGGPPQGDRGRGRGDAQRAAGDRRLHDWGSRKIAFEIDHRPEAAYHLFQFEGDTALLERLNHNLKIIDGVLRFRIIRQRPGAPPPPPSPEPIRAQRPEEPEGRVAARAAADAPPEQDEVPAEGDAPADLEAPAEADAPVEPEAPAAEAEEPEAPAPAEPAE